MFVCVLNVFWYDCVFLGFIIHGDPIQVLGSHVYMANIMVTLSHVGSHVYMANLFGDPIQVLGSHVSMCNIMALIFV